MNCPRCQSPLLPGAKFCTSCGLALAGAGSQETTSPGAQQPADAIAAAQSPFAAPPDASVAQPQPPRPAPPVASPVP
ncbi:MAG TPA: zinc ribbon domain-containing protein, partial [Ktedonobacterales bacterium]|nr:zinc ribbon domain-containing protein [Ktedonobacterales bacterium]